VKIKEIIKDVNKVIIRKRLNRLKRKIKGEEMKKRKKKEK